MRVKWLLLIASGAATLGGSFLFYIIPNETKSIIETSLGTSAFTAAEIILTLTILSVAFSLLAFAIINVRDYYYKMHPSKTKRATRFVLWVGSVFVGMALVALYVALALVLFAGYAETPLVGIAFASTLLFSAVGCVGLLAYTIKNPRGSLPEGGIVVILVGAPDLFFGALIVYALVAPLL